MLYAVLFAFWRFMEIITLIPTMGMLAWFVNGFNSNNLLTPSYILVLFIVSVLALAWAIFTLFSYHRSADSSRFVGLVDLGFVGALIAAVWYLRGIAHVSCTSVSRQPNWVIGFGDLGSVSGPDWDWSTDKPCAMLKASWVFGIMNCVFFFFTAVLAVMHGGHIADRYERKTYTHSSRHSHRRRSGSHSRRSSHSHRQVYV